MSEPSWPLQDAKAQFSAVVDAAIEGVAQHVTRRGQRAVVVISEAEDERLRRRTRTKSSGFVEHLLAIPKSPRGPKGSLRATRIAAVPRDVDFE